MVVNRNDIHEIEMDLTGCCNLSCYICTRNFAHAQHMVRPNIRSMSEITKQIDTFSGLKSFFLAGVVSEPTLHPEFFDLLNYLNKRDIIYEIYTNGGTHDKKWWKDLGEIVPDMCKVIFTVCGSTQELHEKYRVGSKLQTILDNASAFRMNNRKNDYVQHILFEYNKDDFTSGNMNEIMNMVSHAFQVHSEGMRLDNKKIIECPSGIKPPKNIDSKINYIFSLAPNLKSDLGITCKLQSWKKIYIDQFGNLFPCYTYAEYGYPPFKKDSIEFDIDDIIKYKYPPCFLCSKKVEKLMKYFELGFVC